jgi:hypothetical protein
MTIYTQGAKSGFEFFLVVVVGVWGGGANQNEGCC